MRPPVRPDGLPPLPPGQYLGRVCPKNHDNGHGFSVRHRHNHGCVVCRREAKRQRRARQARRAPQPLVLVRKTAAPPVLPAYLALTMTLTPEPCPEGHRYRRSAFVLRYLDDHTCVVCTMQRAMTTLEQRRA